MRPPADLDVHSIRKQIGVVAQNGSYQKLLNEPGAFAYLAKRQIV